MHYIQTVLALKIIAVTTEQDKVFPKYTEIKISTDNSMYSSITTIIETSSYLPNEGDYVTIDINGKCNFYQNDLFNKFFKPVNFANHE